MDEMKEDGGAHVEPIMADASRCKHRKQANPRRKQAKGQKSMNEDPNSYSKEINEESIKKETVFQDEKHKVCEDDIREETTRASDKRVILQNETKREVGSVDDSQKQICEEMQDSIHDSSKLAAEKIYIELRLCLPKKEETLETTFSLLKVINSVLL